MNRREFLLAAATGPALPGAIRGGRSSPSAGGRGSMGETVGGDVSLCLTGDVMLGRGIDQVLPRSVDPRLYEPYVDDARRYVELAERESGEIPAPIAYEYVWGEALDVLDRVSPGVRIINLETAVTDAGEPWPGKGIHYRMHPDNVPCITAAGTDVCVLGNNHVLDWGRAGLDETVRSLRDAGVATAGAGGDREEASAPATVAASGRRVLVFSIAVASSGVPAAWAATAERSGVWFLEAASSRAAAPLARRIESARRPDDLVVVSIHWGGNWGYAVTDGERQLAHALVQEAGVDVVHGHSSHHPKGVEVHDGRPILYGCGDLINDYEGIGGHRRFRPDLSLLYLPRLDREGRLRGMELVPMRIRRFRLQRASKEEAGWLADRLSEVGAEFGTAVEAGPEGRLRLRWED